MKLLQYITIVLFALASVLIGFSSYGQTKGVCAGCVLTQGAPPPYLHIEPHKETGYDNGISFGHPEKVEIYIKNDCHIVSKETSLAYILKGKDTIAVIHYVSGVPKKTKHSQEININGDNNGEIIQRN